MYCHRARTLRNRATISLEMPSASSIAAFAFAMLAFAGNVRALEPAGAILQAPPAVREQIILPQMELGEALEIFEKNYRAPESAGRFDGLDLRSSQSLIKDLSVLSTKFSITAANAQKTISLHPAIFPVPLPPRKQIRWKRRLARGVRPPEISHQTFVVSLNGKPYVIAPGHGVRGDKRYYVPPMSDTAVRHATPEEAKHAFSLDRPPSQSPGKIVMLEGRLPTGESVRLQCAAVRGLEPLNVLLPDVRGSFHDWRRGVEVAYERTHIFVLPPAWSKPTRFRLRRTAGFSGAPAIEQMPEGDAVIGQFIGHRSIRIGNANFTLGVLADYQAIRSAVERFAAAAAN
jgi:hypothetical protein